MLKRVIASIVFLVLASTALGQPASAPAVPPGYVLATAGVLKDAEVLAVAIVTDRKAGPQTTFLIRPKDDGAQAEWFVIRNDDPSKGMERGEIAGLLMGAAEASNWGGTPQAVTIRYETVDSVKLITAAAIGIGLADPVTGGQ